MLECQFLLSHGADIHEWMSGKCLKALLISEEEERAILRAVKLYVAPLVITAQLVICVVLSTRFDRSRHEQCQACWSSQRLEQLLLQGADCPIPGQSGTGLGAHGQGFAHYGTPTLRRTTHLW